MTAFAYAAAWCGHLTNHVNFKTPKGLMNANLTLQQVLCLGFAISSLFVSGTAAAGFGVVVTSFAYAAFAAGALLVVNRNQDPISVGLIMGAGLVLSLFSFLTAVYWGQLSQCQVVTKRITKYSCKESLKAAMRSVCAFATMMFLLQLSFSIMLFYWRANILAESLMYAEVPAASESDEPVHHNTKNNNKGWPQGSEDTI